MTADSNAPHAISLIIADDHPLVLDGLKTLFECLPWVKRVDTARNGIDLCQHPRIDQADAVILDLSMPMLDGISCTRRLRRRFPNLAIIALTGAAHWFPQSDVMDAGADDYLTKQRPGEEVVAALAKALSKRGGSAPPRPHPAEATAPDTPISPREREILKLLAEGADLEETAERLHISPATVRKHRENLYRKLGTSNTVKLVRIAMHLGLVPV